MHTMTMTEERPDGQLFECDECARRVLVRQWKPLVRTVLVEGDDVPHSGAIAPEGVSLSLAAEAGGAGNKLADVWDIWRDDDGND